MNRLSFPVVLSLALLAPIAAGQQIRSEHAAWHNASHVIIPQSRSVVMHPDRQRVEIVKVDARVSILEQTARTALEIHLKNPAGRDAEAVLLLPVPAHAAVSAFDFLGSGAEPTAQLLPAEEARQTYEAIVRQARDPALLEFAGYNLVRSSVFPVPAHGEQRVRITYEHILPADGDRVDYLLPRSESLEHRVPWSISIQIKSTQPISMVYSPSHQLKTERGDANTMRIALADDARFEPGHFVLSYLLEREAVSASLLAYPDPKVGEGRGGYFLLMAGLPARIADADTTVKREVTLVIDRSGSMAGEKMDQVKAAATQIIEALGDDEAFNIVDYSHTVSFFAKSPVPCTQANRESARAYLAAIRPTGGTNIHDALLEALRPAPTPGTLPIVLFLTDGLPTVGQTSEIAIREMVERGNGHGRRLFTFGVGNDVNAPLLDRLADTTRATTTYALPGEDVELKIAQVFKQLYGPVLSDVTLSTRNSAGDVSTRLVRELIPQRLPDLFEDDQLILLGQYTSDEPVTFTIAGNFLGEERRFQFTFNLADATTRNAFVPRLWAARRIAYLVDEIRQAGAASGVQPALVGASMLDDPRYQELINEIVRLSTEFGVLTEYTAFLATEGTNLADWNNLVLNCQIELDTKAVRTRAGQAAVNQSLNFNSQKAQAVLNRGNAYWNAELDRVAISNVQQMCDRAFFKQGAQWVDSRIIAKNEQPQPDEVVEFGSERHMQIARELVKQNRAGVLSLAGDIIIEYGDQRVLITMGEQTAENN